MVQDKVIKVTLDNGDSIDMVITGDQLIQTVRRRMATLMPKARIKDIAEVNGEQGDLIASKIKGGK